MRVGSVKTAGGVETRREGLKKQMISLNDLKKLMETRKDETKVVWRFSAASTLYNSPPRTSPDEGVSFHANIALSLTHASKRIRE